MKGLVKNQNLRILYGSDTYGKALTYLGWVKKQFEENMEFRRLFGNFIPKSRWKDEELWLAGRTDLAKKEPNLFCAGVDQTRTGFHSDWMFLDDIVSKENVRTPKMMDKVVQFFGEAFSLLDPPTPDCPEAGLLFVQGTRWDDADYYGHILRNLADEYDIHIESAEEVDDFGKVSYPFARGGLDAAFLNDAKKIWGSYGYACQYLNNPVHREDALFKREQIKVIPERSVPDLRHLNKYLITDSAASKKEKSDQRVIAIIGKDYKDRVYVLDILVGRWSPYEYCEVIVSQYSKWNVLKMGMESIGLNDIYKDMLERVSDQVRVRLRIESIMGRSMTTKFHRIQSLQGRFETHGLFFSDLICRERSNLLRIEAGQAYGLIPEQFVRITMDGVSRGLGDDVPDCLSDMDKRDNHGRLLFPPPQENFAPKTTSAPTMINGQYNIHGIQQTAQRDNDNFWGNLFDKSEKGRQ